MTWSLFRWVWRLESPIHVGIPPAGSLDRCRLFLPARNLWAALTAELAREDMGEAPENLDKYREIGQELQRSCRFSNLYPSVKFKEGWKAWLPCFEKGEGLCWRRELSIEIPPMPHTAFRGKLLDARPGTAIDPVTDSAAERSLHETEVINPWWRGSQRRKAEPVAMVGYLFCRNQSTYNDLSRVSLLYMGGDIRYGLGKLVRVHMEKTERFFEYNVRLDQDDPQVFSDVILAHTEANANNDWICGSQERLGGWDGGKPIHVANTYFWTPGSKLASEKWHEIRNDGTWCTLL
ncbi:MAG: hypothetical protein QG575_1873 [Euryarchaeota archaeon]|nr:hypothetical protein [Euryarchaeota archaeon]